MSKRIYKYPIPVSDEQIIRLPFGYRIISVQVQGLIPTIWAIVDDEQPMMVDVKVKTFVTGQELPDHHFLNYHGTYQLQGGNLVYHVFTDDAPF